MKTIWKQMNVNKWRGFNSRLQATIYENYDSATKKFVYTYTIDYVGGKKKRGIAESLSKAMEVTDNS